jgi:hypothetical protein
MSSAKKAVPQVDPADLVPERPQSKVEAGLAAAKAEETTAVAAALEDSEGFRGAVRAASLKALVDLGVPEEVAGLALDGDLDGATAASERLAAGAAAANAGELCEKCFPNGWDAVPFDAVSCVHGQWRKG